ncbi:alpha-L-fucosidase [Streptomyces sp. NPDC004542]|uniref:alpha-L-fucosidase n=1 Tax=Streptomyces sp. NPDC004542 TaxID=3154281 RepID=UPI0033A85DB8
MEPTQASAGRSASEWALHQLLDLIQSGSLGPGDRLPPERNLATRLGVSRGMAREAISALVTMGVLESRHGAGVFVTSLEPATVLPRLVPVVGIMAGNHPEDMARLHAQIEEAAAARAAARATPDSLAALTQALTALRIAQHEPAPRGHRDRFKQTIWRLSDDRFHRAVANIAEDPVAEGMILLLRGSREHAECASDEVLRLHESLVRAIADHEPDAARHIARTLVDLELAAHAAPPGAAPAETRPGRAVAGPAAGPAATADEPVDDRAVAEWFRDAKLGLIVHWGIYSVPGWAPLPPDTADGARPGTAEETPGRYFAEWYQASLREGPTADHHEREHQGRPYRSFLPAFQSALREWSPQSWADDFAACGARYVVQVAKHHDGFLLWPSRVRHPRDEEWRASRDVVGEMAAAVRQHGMRFGIFYSSGADWSFDPEAVTGASDAETSRPTGTEYARYVEAQWRELIETYRPDGLWNDTGYPAAGDARRLIRDYRALVPDGVATERFRTSEAGIVPAPPEGGPWESVRPVGLSFGWNRQESAEHTLTGPELVLMLMDVVARNGNLLLGVSPDDHGALPPHQLAALRYLGQWLERFGAAVYATRPWQRATASTADGRTVWFTRDKAGENLYLTVESGATGRAAAEGAETEIVGLRLPPDARPVLLDGGGPVAHHAGSRGSVLRLPASPADSPVTVLRLSPAI